MEFLLFDFKKSLMYHDRPIRSVIIPEIKQIVLNKSDSRYAGRPILLITRMIIEQIGLHSVLLLILIIWVTIEKAFAIIK